MSVLAVAAFELGRRRRMLSSYVYGGVLFACGLLSMLAAGGAFSGIAVGGGADAVHANAPALLQGLTAMLSHLSMMITAAAFGQAVYQDVETGFAPILFTTGLRKESYLGGRFLAALVFILIVSLCIGLGLWVGSLMPFVESASFGPNRLIYYVWPYVISVLPNVLLTGAIFFAMAALLRSMTPVYIGGVVLLLGYLITESLIRDPEQRTLVALLDPFGFRANDVLTQYWTAAERNTLTVPLDGVVLGNRLLWVAISLGLLAFSFWRYRFAHAEGGAPRSAPPLDESAVAPSASLPRAASAPSAGVLVTLQLLWRLTWLSFKETIKSIYFGVIVLAGVLFVVTVTLQLDSIFGTPTYPVTRSMVEVVGGTFVPFMLVIIAFYAGELTFRERDAGIDSIVDALPLPTALPYLAKLFSLLLVPVVLEGVVLATSLIVQTAHGYHHYEIGLYLRALFGIELLRYWTLCVLCFAIHALLQSKYVAHFVIVLFYLAIVFMRKQGLEQNLYLYARLPAHAYSDMNGFGHLLVGVRWFQLYWSLGAALLAVLAYLAWQRGVETTLRVRRLRARQRWTSPLRLATAALALAFAGVGAFVFYNTNVLNHYESEHAKEEKSARYEQQYKPLAAKPQPRVTDVRLDVDIFPETKPPSLRARGRYGLKNQTREPISTVYVNVSPYAEVAELRVGDGAAPTLRDEPLGFYGIDLPQPLLPGQATQLTFDLPIQPRGFTNEQPQTDVVENGTFYSSFDYQPVIGYYPARELTLESERKKYGLAPRPRVPPIEDERARQNNYVSNDADWVHFSASVSTPPDQIALAPGYLQRDWLEGGRRHFEYAMDSPILNFYSVLSARYQVKRDRWRDVALEIYYQAGHEYNLERMMQGMKDALEYCTKNFGPYQHRQVRIIEFPRYQLFAQSFPNTIPYSEAIGFVAKVDPDDPDDVDYPYYVTAHEVAHQWWAHQVIGGNVQGATVLSETMSQYTALMVMKGSFGPRNMKRYLRYELDHYLRGRGFERQKELPLAKVENQDYIYYNKGSLVSYALQDYLGEERFNRAAREFLERYEFEGPPYPISRDLISFIREQTPPELAYLIDDMFENITLFDNRAKSARYHKRADGRYELTLGVTARKLRADELGVESDAPLADLIEVGAVDEHGVGVTLEKRWIHEPEAEITLLLDAPPVRAGIDPLNKLVDRNPDDNVIAAVEETPP